MKIIVVYYSFEGNTKFIAETIAKTIDADILELKPKKEISTHGFMKYLWGGKQVTMGEKPELLPMDKNLNDYELIFIGTPVWAFTFAPPLNTFFANAGLSGKKIALFCSHGGGMKKTLENMKAKLAGNEIISEADFFDPLKNKDQNRQKAEDWAKKIIKDANFA